jgi:uncharacterized protein YlxP (DUF503 family)
MFVGVARIALHISGNSSLKGKRRVMRRVIERTRAKFNAAVAEVADNDLHRRGVIGISVVGNDTVHVDAMLGGIIRFVEQVGVAPVTSIETEVIPLKGDIGASGMEEAADEWSLPSDFEGDFDAAEEDEW